LSGNYEEVKISFVPTKDQISNKKKIYKSKICTLCIDMRNSNKILEEKHINDVAKIHKSFLGIATKVILEYGGKIRDYQGDCILAFWSLNEDNIKQKVSSVVKSAMVIKWFLTKEYLANFQEKYSDIDFGIGIDYGKVHIIRVGLTDNPNHNDLVYLGKNVNFAVAIANTLSLESNCLGVSNRIHSLLEGDMLHSSKDESVNKWSDFSFNFKGETRSIKVTNWGWMQK